MTEIEIIKKAIENIKDKYLRDSIEIISDYNNENGTKIDYRGRQIYELLQNADDCHTDKCSEIGVKFELRDNILIIQNTGKPFDARGIISLMHPNASSKYQGTIGCKGLGFRAVLNWAKKICIYTKEFAVEFSEENAIVQLRYYKTNSDSAHVEELERIDRTAILSSPIVDDDNEEISRWLDKEFSTSIVLYCDNEYVEAIQRQLKELQFEELLFLKHIRYINIISPQANRNIVAVSEDGQFLIQEDGNSESEWTVWSRTGTILQKDGTERDYELMIAYNNNEQERERIRKNGVLYSYFKTEIPMPFPFLVHGTFELKSERNNLIKESKNNEILLTQLVDFISEKGSELAAVSGVCDYSALKFLLPAQPVYSLDTEYGFTKKLKDKIKNYKLFPTIASTYISIEDKPKYSEERFDKYVYSPTFPNLLKHCDDSTVSDYLSELGIRFFYDEELVELLNTDADLYVQKEVNPELIKLYWKQFRYSKIAPKLLVDSDGYRITDDDITVFNNADNRFSLPSWSEMKFINRKLEKTLRGFWDCSPRQLMDILAPYGCKEYSFDRVLGELISQSKNDKDKVTDLLRWLFSGWINNNCSFETGMTNINVRLISREGEIILSSKCYFGNEYDNFVGERLLTNLDEAAFVGDCDTLGLSDKNKQSVKLFLSQLGVAYFPKIESRRLTSSEFDEYKRYNAEKYTTMFVSGITYTHDDFFYQWNTRNIVLADIIGLEDILLKSDYKDIIFWLLNDRDLHCHVASKNEIDNSSYMSGRPYRYKYALEVRKDYMRSWLRKKFTETKWLPTKNGDKSNCKSCTMTASGLSPIIEVIDLDYAAIGELLGQQSKKKIDALFEELDVADDIVDLPYEKIYEVLLHLPELDKEHSLGKSIYTKINRHFDKSETNKLTTNNKMYNKFQREGKVLANIGGNLDYRPIGEVYYVGRKIYSDDILKDYPTLALPRRAGDDKIQQLFGVRSINDIGAIKVIYDKHDLNDEFQIEYQKRLPYIYAKRIGADSKNTTLSKLKSSKIILVKEARTEHNISGVIKEGTLKDYELIYSESIAYIKVPENITMHELRKQIKFSSVAAEVITTILDLDGDKTAFSKIFECESPAEIEAHFRENDEQTFSVLNQAKEKFNQQIDNRFEFWNALATVLSEDVDAVKNKYSSLLPVDFDYSKINEVTNLSFIIEIFKTIEIDVDKYNEYAYEQISLKPFYETKFRELKMRYRNKYLCYIAKMLIEQGAYREDFEIYKNRYNFFVVQIINSIYFDLIDEFEKGLGIELAAIEMEDENYQTYYEKLSESSHPQGLPVPNEANINEPTAIDYVALNKEIASQTGGETVSPELVALKTHGGSGGGNGNGTNHGGGTFDKKTNITKDTDGFIAESKVYNTVLAKINGAGSVEWVSGNAEKAGIVLHGNDACGYDLRYTDENGNIHYVEVKGTASENLEFILTKNEFNFAQSHKEQYELWFVFIKDGQAGTPHELGKIFMFNDGEDFFHNKRFSVEQSEFRLRAKIVGGNI